jgi:dolichol-phosphate mannosyltransferase
MSARLINTQLLRFGTVGIVNTLIDFAVLNALVILLAHPTGSLLLVCNAVSFISASLNSYFANRTWTFSGNRSASVGEFGVFLAISLVGLLLNSAVLWLLTGGTPTSLVHLNLAKLAASAVSMGWNFFGYRVLFRDR